MICEHGITIMVMMPVFKLRRHEAGKPFLRRIKDDRKGDGNRFAANIHEMELMSVQNVAKNDFGSIKFLLFTIFFAFPTTSKSLQ